MYKCNKFRHNISEENIPFLAVVVGQCHVYHVFHFLALPKLSAQHCLSTGEGLANVGGKRFWLVCIS